MHTSRASRAAPWATCLAAATLLSAPAWGSLVRECGLVELHRRASAVFHGRCVARREVADGQPFPYTEYTFEVLAAVKGCADARGRPLATLTFRHAGTREGRKRPDGLAEAPLRLGLPEHEVGEEAVLFLSGESPSSRLCAPVGLYQGKLAVVRRGGKALVGNPAGKRLFEGAGEASFRGLEKAEAAAVASGARWIDLECFLGLCAKVAQPAGGGGRGGER